MYIILRTIGNQTYPLPDEVYESKETALSVCQRRAKGFSGPTYMVAEVTPVATVKVDSNVTVEYV